jgi:hypothetical protein
MQLGLANPALENRVSARRTAGGLASAETGSNPRSDPLRGSELRTYPPLAR